MEPDTSAAVDLADFIAGVPSPLHATAEVARRLAAAGFSPAPGSAPAEGQDAHEYIVRHGTVIAWCAPSTVTDATPVRIVAAHTDSPALKLKPRPDAGAAGWLQASVEVYGSPDQRIS
jgi:aspartyl aminopeptidase